MLGGGLQNIWKKNLELICRHRQSLQMEIYFLCYEINEKLNERVNSLIRRFKN